MQFFDKRIAIFCLRSSVSFHINFMRQLSSKSTHRDLRCALADVAVHIVACLLENDFRIFPAALLLMCRARTAWLRSHEANTMIPCPALSTMCKDFLEKDRGFFHQYVLWPNCCCLDTGSFPHILICHVEPQASSSPRNFIKEPQPLPPDHKTTRPDH